MMKKTIVATLLFFAITGVSSADSRLKVIVNGQALNQVPVVKEGTTLVAMAPILDGMGIDYSWEPRNKRIKAIKNGKEISLVIGNKRAYVNGKAVNLNVAPQVIDGRVFIPVRFIGEATGASVNNVGNLILIRSEDTYTQTPPVTPKPWKVNSATSSSEAKLIKYLNENYKTLQNNNIRLDDVHYMATQNNGLGLTLIIQDRDQFQQLLSEAKNDRTILYELTKKLSAEVMDRYDLKTHALMVYWETVSSDFPESFPSEYIHKEENGQYKIDIPMFYGRYDYAAGKAEFYIMAVNGSGDLSFMYETDL